MMAETIVSIDNLKVSFEKRDEPTQEIIHGIDLHIPKGEIVGIVGESGSGKSISMKGIMNILPENAVLTYDGFSFDGVPQGEKPERIPAAMIFQDPMTALNPLRTIGYHLVEVVQRQRKVSKKVAEAEAIAELTKVGILLPENG